MSVPWSSWSTSGSFTRARAAPHWWPLSSTPRTSRRSRARSRATTRSWSWSVPGPARATSPTGCARRWGGGRCPRPGRQSLERSRRCPVSKPKRCVLAYSGGLDTSVSIRWLQERLGYEVITCTADIGEAKNIEEVTDRALRTGAVAAYSVDARRLFVEEFCFPSLAASAMYEGAYPLATALARPLIAKILVDVA